MTVQAIARMFLALGEDPDLVDANRDVAARLWRALTSTERAQIAAMSLAPNPFVPWGADTDDALLALGLVTIQDGQIDDADAEAQRRRRCPTCCGTGEALDEFKLVTRERAATVEHYDDRGKQAERIIEEPAESAEAAAVANVRSTHPDAHWMPWAAVPVGQRVQFYGGCVGVVRRAVGPVRPELPGAWVVECRLANPDDIVSYLCFPPELQPVD